MIFYLDVFMEETVHICVQAAGLVLSFRCVYSRVELRLLGLVRSTFTHWGILLVF